MKINNVLTVCVGNICRSPVAQALFKQHYPHLEVQSAGIEAPVGKDIHPTMGALLKRNNLELANHRSKIVSKLMMRWADLIIVMESWQRDDLMAIDPTSAGKIFALGHFLKLEIMDPVNHDDAFFEQTCHTIEQCVISWQQLIKPN